MLLDGKKVKLEKLNELKEKVNNLDEQLELAVISIGDDKASNVYVRNKEKMAEQLNFNFKHIKLDEDIKEDELLNIIDKKRINII